MERRGDRDVLEAMLTHHATLVDGVARRARAVRAAVEARGSIEAPAAELVTYLAREVLPHAMAEEHTLYPVAARNLHLEALVEVMVDEHRQLATLTEMLATAVDGAAASDTAEKLETLFGEHVANENERLLLPVASRSDVDLSGLLVQMHRLMEAAQDERSLANDAATPDTETALVRLTLDAATQFADLGQGDAACRLAAAVWAVVRLARPDLATRVTAHLHRLVRTVTAEPVTFSTGELGERAAPSATGTAILDVRSLAPAERHETIFATFGALQPGTAFVLVNDHDPKPLRYQFEAEHAGQFTWESLEAGPKVWRVRIGRPAAAGAFVSESGEPELDVRRFPHGKRHDVIFTTFNALAEGSAFVLVNDHDPKPLRYQFEAQHAGSYSWDYLEAGPAVWRVRIARVAGRTA
ncbi:DUF2249 domain-containing protein [Aciditerrimonas ferrireducens]|uniref:DUF2249 domain-containing protein n=1 Tax=Aciditerrimonas ferrireducens TaxID=667306 RepID=A0ABV6BZF8_9ACTN